MEKEKLLRKIDDAIITEEQAIPVYMSHLKVIFRWSQLSKEHKKRVAGIMNDLISESEGHKKRFEYIKKLLISRD